MYDSRRLSMVVVVGGVALLTAACVTPPPKAENTDGSYCFRVGKSYRPSLTCTRGPIPSRALESEAKRFESTPGKLTVYLVRNRWADVLSPTEI